MQIWLKYCEEWLSNQYKNILGIDLSESIVRLRWLSGDSLTKESTSSEAQSLVIEDKDIGWLLFLLPYRSEYIETQINQALGLRSQLLRESNYTGVEEAGEYEDQDSTWRVGLTWLVDEVNRDDWHQNIIELRRESGAAEEISLDAVFISDNNIKESLDKHGLPRLLLNTRALMRQSSVESEKWFSADSQVQNELKNFSHEFDSPRTRAIARELEKQTKETKPVAKHQFLDEPRLFDTFRVKNFRNLDSLEVTLDHSNKTNAEAIILFGPNGTGKSSLVEAISLAAFGTSPRLEQFMIDKDIKGRNAELYLNKYLAPLQTTDVHPRFAWGGSKNDLEEFSLNTNEENMGRFEGVVLNQEDSIKFTDLSREELAAKVLTGYSSLADTLSGWLKNEEKSSNDTKSMFTRKYGLNSSIKRSATAYNRLAVTLLSEQLQRPPPEFIDWLRFIGRQSDDNGEYSSRLVSDWTNLQDTVIPNLADTLAKLQELGATKSEIGKAIQEKLDQYDTIARKSDEFHQRLKSRVIELREELEVALTQIEVWGTWLALKSNDEERSESANEVDVLKNKIENLAKERNDLEKSGKSLRGRTNLLEQASNYLTNHWTTEHPDTCPVCDSNVADRQGIEKVVSVLQDETNITIQALRARHVEIQKNQIELDAKLIAAGISTNPLVADDQIRLENWIRPFLPEGETLSDWLIDTQHRQQLKDDLSKMGILPEAPKPYASATQESERLAIEFISLTQEADNVLEVPQAIAQVKKSFEHHMQEILKNHLPATLGKVWEELTLTLTTANWLLPERPNMKLEQRGKSLSVQVGSTGCYIRYIYNAAERHVLGLAWFFTHYLAKKRFDEAWMLLDDPAQEMDKPSYRELVRLWETLLRLHQKKDKPFTMIVALHQEERALDAARATNGKLYILGWQKKQEDTSNKPSVKKVVLLAPGFHPIKPEKVFS